MTITGLNVGVVTGDGKRPAGIGGKVGVTTGDGVGFLDGFFVGGRGFGGSGEKKSKRFPGMRKSDVPLSSKGPPSNVFILLSLSRIKFA